MATSISTQRITALFVMTAGFAWTAGNFVQPDKPLGVHIFTTLIHALPVALTILCAVPLLRHGDGGPRWATRGVTALAVLYTIGLVVILGYSISNPDPNAFGIHSLGDAETATVVAVGNLLWLSSLLPARTRTAEAERQHIA